MTPEAQNLIQSLLNPDPKQRLGARGVEEIKNHPWFKGKDYKNPHVSYINI